MTTTQIVLLVVAILVVLLIVAAVLAAAKKKKRTQELRGTFGDEYDRTVQTSDKRRDAERELAQRKQEHEKLDIRPLTSASRQRYLTAWDGVQNRFVDNPVLALSEADALLTQLLGERGFPTGDPRQSERMLSVEHGRVLEGFRAGHAIEQANSTNRADTEQVRQGMLHFRQVFEELVSEDADSSSPRRDGDATGRSDVSPDVQGGAGVRDDSTSVRDDEPARREELVRDQEPVRDSSSVRDHSVRDQEPVRRDDPRN